MFLELIFGLVALMVLLSVGLFLLKVVFTLAILPLRLLRFLSKGLLTLVVLVPVLLVGGVLLTAAVPLVLVLVALPICLLGGFVFALVR